MPDQSSGGARERRHPELTAEQRYVDQAYERLDEMREAAGRVARATPTCGAVAPTRPGSSGTSPRPHPSAPRGAGHRQHSRSCFGRIDLEPATSEEADGDRYYIGRVSVTDDEQTPLVVDWRAPVAEPFYRATGVDPMDVVRRRHFQPAAAGWSGSTTRSSTPTPPTRPASRSSAKARCSPRSSGSAPGAWATSSPRSRPSRTKRSRADLPGILVVAGGRARGRPRSRSTVPRTCCTRTAAARVAGCAARGSEPDLPALHRRSAPVARRRRRAAVPAPRTQAAAPRPRVQSRPILPP